MSSRVDSRRVFQNAAVAVLGLLASGLALLLLYRFLLRVLGVELVGVWALVLAASAIAHVANLGFADSIVTFIARALVRGDQAAAAAFVETAAISQAIFFAAALSLGYPVIVELVRAFLPDYLLESAYSVLPFAAASLWFSVVGEVLLRSLDGCQRTRLRSTVEGGFALGGVALAFMFVHIWGFSGLAYAQLAQSALLMIAAWTLVTRLLPQLPAFPYRWRRTRMIQLMRYGLPFQASTVANMFFDPGTKWLLGVFGGASVVGYYEMAARLVGRLRDMLVVGSQVLIPAVAELHEVDSKRLGLAYAKAFRVACFAALTFYSTALISLPFLSEFMIGHYEEGFVNFAMILLASAFAVSLMAPAYFFYLGAGILRWTTLASLSIAVINMALGALLGAAWSAMGVVAAQAFAFIAGSSLVVVRFHSEHEISWASLRLSEHCWLAAACLTGVAASLSGYFYWRTLLGAPAAFALMIGTFLLVVLPAVWLHPIRPLLQSWLPRRLGA